MIPSQKELKERIEHALGIAMQFSQIDGAHHKAWTIDQMVRALTGCPMEDRVGQDFLGHDYNYKAQGESEEYRKFIDDANDEDHFPWDVGIAP